MAAPLTRVAGSKHRLLRQTDRMALREFLKLLCELADIVFTIPGRRRFRQDALAYLRLQTAPARQHAAAEPPHEGFVFARIFEHLPGHGFWKALGWFGHRSVFPCVRGENKARGRAPRAPSTNRPISAT